MKKLSVFSLILMCVTSFAITACSSDKNESSNNNPIVGTWSCSHHYYSSTGSPDTYTFNADGTYRWSCPGHSNPNRSGHYTYNQGTGLLSEAPTGINYTYTYYVSISGNQMVMIDQSGSSYTYYKR